MLRPDPILVNNLARQHHDDLMAAAERDRLVRAARLARRTAANAAQISTHRDLAAPWHLLGRTLGRISASGKLAANGQ
jgi:hypothetical protein